MGMVKKFISYYKPHKKLFIADMICAFLIAVSDLFYPKITGSIIDDFIPNRNLRMLLIWLGILLAIYLIKAGLNFFVEYYGHLVGVGIQGNMRRDVFKKLQRLPFSYFDEHKTGTIMSRIINDLMDISELAHHGPEDLFLSLVMLIGAFIMLCQVNVTLTLIIFATLPFIVFFATKMRTSMMEAFTKTREEIAEVNANLENSISGMRVSRAYTAAEHETKKFEGLNNRFMKARARSYKVMARFSTGMTLFMDLLYFIVLLSGGLFYFNGIITIGDFVEYLLYISMFLTPIRRLVSFYEQFQNGMTGFKRFEEIMSQAEEEESPEASDLPDAGKGIEFENVSFSYDKKDGDEETRMIISNLSLHIEGGKTVALVGPSGGGKTTLCHLIPRFYEINSGAIRIGGKDIRDLSRYSLRKNIGMVAQDVFLFTGTIKENIAYGNLDATDEEIIEAAKKANIHDFILSMPDGYDTYIGERGVKLSGGQKQRVSIARVFLKNPPILILDEATSALDNATEMLIQQALEKLSEGRTSLIVAHRLSTIKNADEIIVLTDDGIAERGTHEDLLAKGGIYAGLYQYQFRE